METIIFGGDKNCQHKWGDEQLAKAQGDTKSGFNARYFGKDIAPGKQAETAAHKPSVNTSQGQFCQICGSWKGQHGLEPTIELYIAHEMEFLKAVWRVLRSDGVVFWNLGDSYYAHGGSRGNKVENPGPDNKWPVAYTHTFKARDSSLKPKDCCLIPERFAIAAQEQGWWVRSRFPWIKQSAMPESVTDRPTVSNEWIFMLTKSGSTQYWTHPRKRGTRTKPKPDHVWRHKNTGLEVAYQPVSDRIIKRFWSKRNLWKGHDYHWDADAIRVPHVDAADIHRRIRKDGDYQHGKSQRGWMNGSIDRADQAIARGRNRRTGDWLFESTQDLGVRGLLLNEEGTPLAMVVNPQPYKGSHFAVFPERLVMPLVLVGAAPKVCVECGAPWERVIESTGHINRREQAHVPNNSPTKTDSTGWAPLTKPTDKWLPTCDHDPTKTKQAVILDPFAGTGTVGVVAEKCGRDYILIEASEEYVENHIKKRLRIGPAEIEAEETGDIWLQPKLLE